MSGSGLGSSGVRAHSRLLLSSIKQATTNQQSQNVAGERFIQAHDCYATSIKQKVVLQRSTTIKEAKEVLRNDKLILTTQQFNNVGREILCSPKVEVCITYLITSTTLSMVYSGFLIFVEGPKPLFFPKFSGFANSTAIFHQ